MSGPSRKSELASACLERKRDKQLVLSLPNCGPNKGSQLFRPEVFMATCPTNRDEILELAQLEVLGALEPAESARLERLFRDAPVVLQREVVDLQANLCQAPLLLPAVEPERSLKLQVLASVAKAVEQADEELAPIAAIGRPVPMASSVSIQAGDSPSYQRADAVHRADAGIPSAPMVGDWRRSALVWRAAAVVLTGALVASVAFNIATARQATRISELALQRVISDQLGQYIGADLSSYLDQRCIVRGLVGATARDNGSVSVMLAPDFASLMVVWVDLPAEQEFTLKAIDRATGTSKVLGTFTAANPVGGSRVVLAPGAANANSDWEVVDNRGVVNFSSWSR